MKKIVNKIISHPLISGSAIVFIGSMMINILGYFFNLAMGRLLSAQDYGVLAALISILSIFSVFSTTIMVTFTKFSASFKGQGKDELISFLLKQGSIWVICLALPIFMVLVLLANPIANFLHITNLFLIYLIFITVLVSLIAAVPFGILQGMLRFVPSSIVNILSSLIKVILSIVLVILGFHVAGAVLALVISSIFGYIFIFFPLKKYIGNKIPAAIHINNFKNEIFFYSLPVLFASLGITLFSSLDIILVKHFFNNIQAGQYAALSLMCKSIFYAVGPIISVFFPLITQKKEKNESLEKTIILATLLIGAPALALSIFYFLFPYLIINIFFPTYKDLAIYLGPFSIYIFLFTLIALFNSLCLSLPKTKVFIFTIVASILETMLISIWHATIAQVILDLIIVSLLLLFSLLIYYPFVTYKYGKR